MNGEESANPKIRVSSASSGWASWGLPRSRMGRAERSELVWAWLVLPWEVSAEAPVKGCHIRMQRSGEVGGWLGLVCRTRKGRRNKKRIKGNMNGATRASEATTMPQHKRSSTKTKA